jgi:hypothetical protein
MGNEVIKAFGEVSIEYVPENWIDQFFYNNITLPMHIWWAEKMENFKYNSLDIITVVAIVLIATFGLKMFVFSKTREKDVGIIWFTVVFYTIARLYWRVVLNV